MTDITAAELETAIRFSRETLDLDADVRRHTDSRVVGLARAILKLAAEREQAMAVVEAADKWQRWNQCVSEGADHCPQCALATALDSYRAKVQR